MKQTKYDIFIIGVGGQGIGLLSEALARAADYASLPIHGTDTHGLAQRGGTVTSHVRLGDQIYSPFIRKNNADIIISLERTEALRALLDYGKEGTTLIYYDAKWQPLPVRLKQSKEISGNLIQQECQNRKIKVQRVYKDDLSDTRMQNIVMLASLIKLRIIAEITAQHIEKALKDLLAPGLFEVNINLFNSIVND